MQEVGKVLSRSLVTGDKKLYCVHLHSVSSFQKSKENYEKVLTLYPDAMSTFENLSDKIHKSHYLSSQVMSIENGEKLRRNLKLPTEVLFKTNYQRTRKMVLC